MNISIEDGKCQFRENLFGWGKEFHKQYIIGNWSCNIAGTQQFENVNTDSTWLTWSSSDEGEEIDSLEEFFARKRIIFPFCEMSLERSRVFL